MEKFLRITLLLWKFYCFYAFNHVKSYLNSLDFVWLVSGVCRTEEIEIQQWKTLDIEVVLWLQILLYPLDWYQSLNWVNGT